MSWYEEWFWSDAYTTVYDHRDEAEAERLVDLIEREIDPAPQSHLLDVGCGRGRHARILARRGYRVTGIDLSSEALAQARARAEAEGIEENLSFQVGDMREPACDSCADGVVNLFTSFGYFEDDIENERALAAMAFALRPGGWFLQDFLNAPLVVESLGTSDRVTEDGTTIRQHRWIEDGRVNKEITIEHDDGTDSFQESVRLYSLDDFTQMYEAVGLELIETFGDYDGGPHSSNSPRLLLHAQKPSS